MPNAEKSDLLAIAEEHIMVAGAGTRQALTPGGKPVPNPGREDVDGIAREMPHLARSAARRRRLTTTLYLARVAADDDRTRRMAHEEVGDVPEQRAPHAAHRLSCGDDEDCVFLLRDSADNLPRFADSRP